jgi:hypothetical protein
VERAKEKAGGMSSSWATRDLIIFLRSRYRQPELLLGAAEKGWAGVSSPTYNRTIRAELETGNMDILLVIWCTAEVVLEDVGPSVISEVPTRSPYTTCPSETAEFDHRG